MCAKRVALTAHGGRNEDGRSQWAQGEQHTLVQGGALCWEGEHCGCQPRPLWGPCPWRYLRGHRQTPSRCTQTRHLPRGARWWHDTHLPVDGREGQTVGHVTQTELDRCVVSAHGQGPSGGGQSRCGMGSSPHPAAVPPQGVRQGRAPGEAIGEDYTQVCMTAPAMRPVTCLMMDTDGATPGFSGAERSQTQCLGLEGSTGLARASGLHIMG